MTHHFPQPFIPVLNERRIFLILFRFFVLRDYIFQYRPSSVIQCLMKANPTPALCKNTSKFQTHIPSLLFRTERKIFGSLYKRLSRAF